MKKQFLLSFLLSTVLAPPSFAAGDDDISKGGSTSPASPAPRAAASSAAGDVDKSKGGPTSPAPRAAASSAAGIVGNPFTTSRVLSADDKETQLRKHTEEFNRMGGVGDVHYVINAYYTKIEGNWIETMLRSLRFENAGLPEDFSISEANRLAFLRLIYPPLDRAWEMLHPSGPGRYSLSYGTEYWQGSVEIHPTNYLREVLQYLLKRVPHNSWKPSDFEVILAELTKGNGGHSEGLILQDLINYKQMNLTPPALHDPRIDNESTQNKMKVEEAYWIVSGKQGPDPTAAVSARLEREGIDFLQELPERIKATVSIVREALLDAMGSEYSLFQQAKRGVAIIDSHFVRLSDEGALDILRRSSEAYGVIRDGLNSFKKKHPEIAKVVLDLMNPKNRYQQLSDTERAAHEAAGAQREYETAMQLAQVAERRVQAANEERKRTIGNLEALLARLKSAEGPATAAPAASSGKDPAAADA